MYLVSSHSQKGRKAENQDALLASSCLNIDSADTAEAAASHTALSSPHLLTIVADGVSSCKKPKQASETAIATFLSTFNHECGNSPSVIRAITKALNEANNALYFADNYERRPSMLSTFSGLLFDSNKASLFHIGDSRIYRYYNNQLEQLTTDDNHHTGHYKGALSKALGYEAQIKAEFFERRLIEDEIYLIVTDGVYEYIEAPELKVLLNNYKLNTDDPVAEQICANAYKGGSRDNLSCIVVYIKNSALNTTANVDTINSSEHNKRTTPPKPLTKKFPPHLCVGDVLDEFEIIEELASNPRSYIYLAKDTLNDNALRIIKTPSDYFSDDQLYIHRFFKEERIGLSFDHISIIKFYPKPLNSQYIYHVTEYIEGINLRQYIKENAPITLSRTHKIIEKIAVALRVLHREHLLHQDLKPENIMMTKQGQIKIIDLGSVGSLILKNEAITPAGALEYTAPEYFTGKNISESSDIFSLAIITYELLTGRTPFTSHQLLTSKSHLSCPPITKLNPSLPRWLDEVFERAFAVESRVRHQALSEFSSEINPEHNASNNQHKPLIIRNPLLFWQAISGLLLVITIILSIKVLS